MHHLHVNFLIIIHKCSLFCFADSVFENAYDLIFFTGIVGPRRVFSTNV